MPHTSKKHGRSPGKSKRSDRGYLEVEKDIDISEFVGVQVVVAEAGSS
jgi:hypothetical protein